MTLEATERAVEAMQEVRGAIMPFPGGIVRSGSKVESRYKILAGIHERRLLPDPSGRR